MFVHIDEISEYEIFPGHVVTLAFANLDVTVDPDGSIDSIRAGQVVMHDDSNDPVHRHLFRTMKASLEKQGGSRLKDIAA